MNPLDSNLYTWDKVSRALIGSLLLASVFILAQASLAWLTYLGAYFVFTAMLDWDPLYAVIRRIFARGKRPMVTPRQAYSS